MVDAVGAGARNAQDGMQLAVERVTAGVARTDAISAAIRDIRSSSEQTVERVNQIGNAIGEQGAASTNIAQHVENIAKMAEECSAAATGSAASARELNALAAQMRGVVEAYTL